VLATASSGLTAINTDTLASSLSTGAPQPNVPFTVTFSGQATTTDSGGDGPYLYAVVQPAGAGGCQPTYGDDQQVVGSQATVLTSGSEVSTGQFSKTYSDSSPKGLYTVCAWLEDRGWDDSGSGYTPADVTATASPVTFRVGAPPPPPPPPPACVVPRFRAGESLSAAERAIRAGHCSVGPVGRRYNRQVRAGGVLALSPAPGGRYPNGSAVSVTLSRGAKPVHRRKRR
jgi:hypothetical protein